MDGNVRMLHVDDDSKFLEMTERLLADEELEIVKANSVSEALEHLEKQEFECILSDYDMPEKNGLTLLDEVKERFPELPFIMLTGKGSESVASEAISKGVTDYIRKDRLRNQKEVLRKRIFNSVEKKRAKEKLEESREKYRTLVKYNGTAEYVYRGDSFLFVDEQVQEITEYSEEELMEKNPLTLIHPDDRERVKKYSRRRHEGKEAPHSYEAKILDKSGESHYCRFYISEIQYDGQRAFLGSVNDITDFREAELELERSREKFKGIYENANDAILIIKDRRFVECNQMAAEYLGAPKEEIEGSRIADFAPDKQPDGTPSEKLAEKYIGDLEKGDDPVFEWRAKTKSGVTFDVEVSLSTIESDEENAVMAIARPIEGTSRPLKPLYKATKELVSAESVEEVSEKASNAARDILGFPGTAVRLYNPENERLELESWGGSIGEIDDRPDFDVHETPHGEAFLNDEIKVCSIPEDDSHDREIFNQTMYLPLGNHGIMSLGILEGEFTERDRKLAELLANTTRAALDNVSKIEELREKREENYEKYSTLVEEAENAVLIFKDGLFVFANDQAARLLKTDKENIIGEKFTKYVAPEDREDVLRNHKRRIKGQDVENRYEMTGLTAEGEKIDVELNLSLISYEGEKAVMAIARDISEMKEREEKVMGLQDTARKLMQADDCVSASNIAIEQADQLFGFSTAVVYAEEHGIFNPISWTDRVDKLYEGPETEEREGGQVSRVYDNREPEFVTDSEELAKLGCCGENVDVAYILPLSSHGVLVIGAKDPENLSGENKQFAKLLSLNLSTALDSITYKNELKAERDRFASMFENLPEPATHIYFEDDEPMIKNVNPAFERIFGVDEEEAKGSSINELIVPEDLMDQAKDIDEGFRSGGDIIREIQRMTSNGLRDFIFTSVPVDTPGESEEGYGIYTDITRRKRKEREIKRQNERLENFASVLSHDLRNPLNVAQGYLDVAKDEPEEDNFNEISKAHDRMEQIIESVLTMAKHGKRIEETEEVELEEIARYSWDNVDTKDADLSVNENKVLDADEEKLARLFENLFRNAVEHGGESVKVEIGLLSGSREGFYVRDNGKGVDEDEIEEIADYGFSTEEGGTGFGLPIVKNIAEAHGWTLNIENDDGARFEIVTKEGLTFF